MSCLVDLIWLVSSCFLFEKMSFCELEPGLGSKKSGTERIEAYANSPPVWEESNAEVPRTNSFNRGPVNDQNIFTGPYSCEEDSLISSLSDTSLMKCRDICHHRLTCRFYQFEEATMLCSLFTSCDVMQFAAWLPESKPFDRPKSIETHISYGLITSCSWGEMRMEKVLKFKTIWIFSLFQKLDREGLPTFCVCTGWRGLIELPLGSVATGKFLSSCKCTSLLGQYPTKKLSQLYTFRHSKMFISNWIRTVWYLAKVCNFVLGFRIVFFSFILWGFCLLLSKNDKRLARPRSTTEDALQLLSGEASGRCGKCEYVNVSHQEQSLSKIPLPDEFLPGSQIQVSCNDTSRLFAGDGFNIDGPRDSAVFTCVAGNWVGAGEWQLENLSCQGCLQVGTSSLQTLSNVSLVAAYFLEHRQIQVTYAEAIPGCLSAIEPTAARIISLVSSHQQLDISTDNKTVTCQKKKFWC